MKHDVCMRLRCTDCHKKFDIKDDEIDNYNIFWIWTGEKKILNGYKPQLLCPQCTEKACEGIK